ncbi:type IV pilus secretin PilQ [Vibrio sp. SS-MA-C1-2]|uniref:type IV pilus secretin PilQ n=1 Tax=Vibrio sp. SS-MA-C1-2 TaxID=2908646 RepID=UPI001F257CE6|nr:type IV pilus secretin PilQ [Vibrio sp. SS-MA-C1-2]UJF19223.1 type IV pilus secretin PilQ [Vibrio sp. SS-MA-C1-2]
MIRITVILIVICCSFAFNSYFFNVSFFYNSILNSALANDELPSTNTHISLQFDNIPIHHAIQSIADKGRLNIIISDDISGRITLDIRDRSPIMALDAILISAKLAKVERNGIWHIYPLNSPIISHSEVLNQPQSQQKIRLIPIKYSLANELKKVIAEMAILGVNSKMSVDQRTNSLIIQSTPEHILRAEKLIKQLDIAVKQVVIDARIVIVDQGVLEEFGVRWGLSVKSPVVAISGGIEGNYANQSGSDFDPQSHLNVDLSANSGKSSSIAFQLASLGKHVLLDLELSALEAESRAEIISSPRLLAANNQTATIEQGTEIPYQESTESGATSITFRKAVLSLEVTPRVTFDGYLLLNLAISQDRVGNTVKIGTGEAVSINTQRINTQVFAKDRETIILGGIYQQQSLSGVDKVPILADIPAVGALFQRKYQQSEKKNC